MGRQTKSLIFVSQRLRQPVREEEKGEKKRKKRKKKEKEKKTKTKVCFVLKSWVFWIPKAPFSSRKFLTLSKIQNIKIFNVF